MVALIFAARAIRKAGAKSATRNTGGTAVGRSLSLPKGYKKGPVVGGRQTWINPSGKRVDAVRSASRAKGKASGRTTTRSVATSAKKGKAKSSTKSDAFDEQSGKMLKSVARKSNAKKPFGNVRIDNLLDELDEVRRRLGRSASDRARKGKIDRAIADIEGLKSARRAPVGLRQSAAEKRRSIAAEFAQVRRSLNKVGR